MVASRGYTPPEATVAELVAFREGLGMARSVLVQPSVYGTDNSCMVDALHELGDSARGVAVVAPDVADAELAALHAAGVRGIRINLESSGNRDPQAVTARLGLYAERLAPLGWHIQIYTALPVLAQAADAIAALPVPVVIDHYGLAAGTGQPGFAALISLLRAGHVYLKMSAPYRLDAPPPYAVLEPVARRLIEEAPARLVWASDWPHTDRVPGRAATDLHPYRRIDDADILSRFLGWCPDDAVRKLILTDNPSRLYDFA